MGGLGSGRPPRSNAEGFVESYLRIDVRRWQREGLLEPNRRFSHCWQKGEGAADFKVNVEVREDLIVVLNYEIYRPERPRGQRRESLEERVGLTYTPCHYGGQRSWFVCPMAECGRRVAILYLVGLHFLCRRCHSLVYASQRMDRPQRASRRIQKIWARLGQPLPEKHRRMHWATYERVRGELQTCVENQQFATDKAEEDRKLYTLRTEEAMSWLRPGIIEGKVGTIRAYINCLKHLAKINGYKAPSKIEPPGKDGAPVLGDQRESELMAARLSEEDKSTLLDLLNKARGGPPRIEQPLMPRTNGHKGSVA
jgi:hypothetical protein